MRHRTAFLWAYLDLNQGPHAYQACALNQLSYRPFDNYIEQNRTATRSLERR